MILLTRHVAAHNSLHDSAEAPRCRTPDPWHELVFDAACRFADYRVPVVLRQMGILAYSADLALKVGTPKPEPGTRLP